MRHPSGQQLGGAGVSWEERATRRGPVTPACTRPASQLLPSLLAGPPVSFLCLQTTPRLKTLHHCMRAGGRVCRACERCWRAGRRGEARRGETRRAGRVAPSPDPPAAASNTRLSLAPAPLRPPGGGRAPAHVTMSALLLLLLLLLGPPLLPAAPPGGGGTLW